MTAAEQVIRIKEIGTVSIPLADGSPIELHNVALAPGCDLNLISLGQLRESRITYHDNPAVITLMKDGKVIAHARKNQNLFTLKLAQPGRAMATIKTVSIQLKTMAITGGGRPTHLVSQNKRIHLWHRRLAHISNACIVRAFKLVDGINLDNNSKEYNLAEVLIDSDNSDMSELSDSDKKSLIQHLLTKVTPTTVVRQIKTEDSDVLDKLCTLCVGSKSTRVVQRNKSMTPTTDKLEEVHTNLWGLYNPPSQSNSTYATILICKHTQKTWTLYLRRKDDFIDAFQAWLPQVKAESGCSMKILRVDGGGEFILYKFRTFYEKRSILIKYAAPYMHEENGLAK